MSAFQPVPSYAEVAFSHYDEKTKTTKSTFNPVWLSWFISLNGFTSSGITTHSSDLTGFEVLVGVGGTEIENLGSSGTAGDVLTSQGLGLPPVWSATAFGLVNNNRIVSNISGGTTTPIGNTLTALLDSILGNTRGALITRTATAWVKLDPGAAGTKLTSNGAGADLSWT